MSRRRSLRIVFLTHYFPPEVGAPQTRMFELGALRNPLAIRLAEMLEGHIYRRASRITVPTHGIYETLASRGISTEKLCLLTNAVDVDVFQPQPWPGKPRVFLYAGTHGLSQGLDVVLEAAKLVDDPDVEFVLAGEGADKAALVAKAEDQG